MNSCCSTPTPKEKKFGVKVCRERKCQDLQRDPKYPDSPEFCQVTHGMPGSMSCCVKEMNAETFIRHISGQLNSSPYSAPNPGIKNCPATCPYKIITIEERPSYILAEGKKNTKSVKVGKCALDGMTLGGYGGCPCNVLGNKDQEAQIAKLNEAITSHRDCGGHFCHGRFCPDGVKRCNKDDLICPVIKIHHSDLKECPLWRIPAKLLPAPSQSDCNKITIKEPVKTSEKTEKPVEKKQAATKKKEKARSIEDRIDALEQDLGIYLWADITQCCVLIQEIKCLLRSVRKKEKTPAKTIRKAAPRIEPNQSDLFSFDVQPAEPAIDKIPHIGWCSARACPELDWEGGICITTGKKIKEQTYCPTQHLAEKPQPNVRKCCPTCAHHKIKKTFEETCPRLPDLMFMGGHMSAMGIMLETSLKDCEHWNPKPENPEKKKPAKKSPAGGPKPYTIYIKKSDGKHPLIVSCDSRDFGGMSNPCDSREEVIQRALFTLNGFAYDVKKSTHSKKPLPVTLKTTLFIDKTGMFNPADFFDETGEPKKPEPVKKSASKKSKKEE